MVDVQPAAVSLLLRIHRGSNKSSRPFITSLSIFHLAVIRIADARRYSARRGDSGGGFVSVVAAGVV